MRTLDLASLDIFRAVVREGGVVRASARLNRVQSNVTTRIKHLEERLGVALFRRQGRGLALTEAGQTLLAYAERLLRLADEAEGAVRRAPLSATMRLGSMESTAASRLPALLSSFHKAEPDIGIDLRTGTSAGLIARVRDYALDAALVGEPFDREGLEVLPVFAETLVLVTERDAPPITRAADLSALTLLVFAEGCSYRRVVHDWLARDSSAPQRIIELASYHAIIACASAGTGCGIAPLSVLGTLVSGETVRTHALPDGLGRNVTHLVWRAPPSPALARLIAHFPPLGAGAA